MIGFYLRSINIDLLTRGNYRLRHRSIGARFIAARISPFAQWGTRKRLHRCTAVDTKRRYGLARNRNLLVNNGGAILGEYDEVRYAEGFACQNDGLVVLHSHISDFGITHDNSVCRLWQFNDPRLVGLYRDPLGCLGRKRAQQHHARNRRCRAEIEEGPIYARLPPLEFNGK